MDMADFLGENFLLHSPTAEHLFHDVAKDLPIIDYHCHLNPKEIAENVSFPNIGRLMLGGDHYKWRGMSACGFDNEFIRTSTDKQRFFAYARILPQLIGNPLYHWTHIELQRVFGITDILNEQNAPSIWDRANEQLQGAEFRAWGLIQRFKVSYICTTDDPADSLEYHRLIAGKEGFATRVLPAFRPDRAVKANLSGFAEYIGKLSSAADITISGTEDVIRALHNRIQYFHRHGARLSDHALDVLTFAEPDFALADKAFAAGMAGGVMDKEALAHYQTALLLALGGMYKQLNWTQQYHIGAMRNANTRMFLRFGPDTGFDALRDVPVADDLAKLLDAQEKTGSLPQTILYALSPGANHALAVLAGTFQGGVPGKIQFGSAWWFADSLDGMTDQIKALASVGALGTFIGMLTDSRSFTSYPRHEYFRRLLCDIIGSWVERGEYPRDEAALRQIVECICYANAKAYFRFPESVHPIVL
jgi:glucuronate isomerase